MGETSSASAGSTFADQAPIRTARSCLLRASLAFCLASYVSSTDRVDACSLGDGEGRMGASPMRMATASAFAVDMPGCCPSLFRLCLVTSNAPRFNVNPGGLLCTTRPSCSHARRCSSSRSCARSGRAVISGGKSSGGVTTGSSLMVNSAESVRVMADCESADVVALVESELVRTPLGRTCIVFSTVWMCRCRDWWYASTLLVLGVGTVAARVCLERAFMME